MAGLRDGGSTASPVMQRTPKFSGSGRPVTVIYFPKHARPAPVSPVGRTTVSIPEIREEIVTEAEAVAPPPAAKKRRRTRETPLVENTLAAVASSRRTPQEVRDLSLFGHQLFEMGRVEEARVIFEGLVATGARDAFAHTMLGTIYLALKDQTRALGLFQVALELDPDDVSALVYRGEIRLNKGKVKSALEDLTRALRLGEADDPFVERAGRLLRMAKVLLKQARKR